MQTFCGKALWLGILLSGSAWAAQNSDISLMVGPVQGSVDVAGRSGAAVTADVNFQAAFSHQVLRTKVGDLWIEVPVTFLIHGSVSTSQGASVVTNGSTLITPGARFVIPLGTRFSVYAAGGGGFAVFSSDHVTVGANNVGISLRRTVEGTLDVAGGMDFRLTKLLSLRGEVRDFITQKDLAGFAGHHHVVYDFGLAFHF